MLNFHLYLWSQPMSAQWLEGKQEHVSPLFKTAEDVAALACLSDPGSWPLEHHTGLCIRQKLQAHSWLHATWVLFLLPGTPWPRPLPAWATSWHSIHMSLVRPHHYPTSLSPCFISCKAQCSQFYMTCLIWFSSVFSWPHYSQSMRARGILYSVTFLATGTIPTT